MGKHTFRWSFGSGSYIDVYKNDIACAHFNYDNRLKFQVAWSVGYASNDEWKRILDCVKEAKAILKRLRRI